MHATGWGCHELQQIAPVFAPVFAACAAVTAGMLNLPTNVVASAAVSASAAMGEATAMGADRRRGCWWRRRRRLCSAVEGIIGHGAA